MTKLLKYVVLTVVLFAMGAILIQYSIPLGIGFLVGCVAMAMFTGVYYMGLENE